MSRKFIISVTDDSGTTEDHFIAKVKANDTIILKTFGEMWGELHKNKAIARLDDTGDGVVIDIESHRSSIHLDYAQVQELWVLLDLYHRRVNGWPCTASIDELA